MAALAVPSILGWILTVFCGTSLAAFSVRVDVNKNETTPGSPVHGKIDISDSVNASRLCQVHHAGHVNGSQSSYNTTGNSIPFTLSYSNYGLKSVGAECTNGINETASGEVTLQVFVAPSNLTVDLPLSEQGSFLAKADARYGTAYFTSILGAGWPLYVKAKVNNVSINPENVNINSTSRTVSIPISRLGDSELELEVYNRLSSVKGSFNVTVQEEIEFLWVTAPEAGLVNATVSVSASASSGTNLQYEFCFQGPAILHGERDCISSGVIPFLNYTFTMTGQVNVTVSANNSVSRASKTAQMAIVNPVKGFTLTASKSMASTSDVLTFTLKAPDEDHFPMEVMLVMFLKGEQIVKEPEYLNIGPLGTQSVDLEFSPGIFKITAMVFARLSSMNATAEVRIGDPIQGTLSISGSPWRSDELFIVTVSGVQGWGFNYTVDFGDNEIVESAQNATKSRLPDELTFNHTYSVDETFTVLFDAANEVHEQVLQKTVSIFHPVTAFRVVSATHVSIPDGWATFDIRLTEQKPPPTEASCTVDYGNMTRVMKGVDWTSGFPVSYKYKSVGMYDVKVSCANSVSSHSSNFQVSVNDRDVDIQGLTISVPKFVLVNSKVNIGISIEKGSNTEYRIRIGLGYDEVVADQRFTSEWVLEYTFSDALDYTLFITAYNSVSRLEQSVQTTAVKLVSGFNFIVPIVASSSDDFKLAARSPNSDHFPMGPLSISFFREDELLNSVDVQSIEPKTDTEALFSRWRTGEYQVRVVISSPVSEMELAKTITIENPVPFFTFTVDKIVTIPDGVVSYSVETRSDETPPTDAMCVLEYGDGQSETIPWDYLLAFNHTFVSTGFFNATLSCENRVSDRRVVENFDVCEFTADGFRFDYPKVVPLNSSSPNVNVRFKYNICGLTSITSDSQIAWIFEPGTAVKTEPTIDWEEEHWYWQRGSYRIKVLIKSLQTDTETMVELPLKVGILNLQCSRHIGRVDQDVFNLTISGAFGKNVNFVVNFGDGERVSFNKTNLQASDKLFWTKTFSQPGSFHPQVLAWSKDFAEEVRYEPALVTQRVVGDFDINLEQESMTLPVSLSVTVDLRPGVSPKDVTCFVDAGDGLSRIISYNWAVQQPYSLRIVHSYKSYGPFDLEVNCSNYVSFRILTGQIHLKSHASSLITSPRFTFWVVFFNGIFVVMDVVI